LEDLRVLVIEDNILHVTLIIEQLTKEMGIPESKITCSYDGIEAIDELQKNVQQDEDEPV
jgi:CheY-like chemotaxis protein